MSYYSVASGGWVKGQKPSEIKENNPNKQFKRWKWLEDVISSERKLAEEAIAKEQTTIKDCVDVPLQTLQTGINQHATTENIDITEIGDSTTVVVDPGDEQYEERIDRATGIRYLTFRSKGKFNDDF